MPRFGQTAQTSCLRPLACIFSVILHKSSLKYDSIPASDLYNLTKNLLAQLDDNLCAVLPLLCLRSVNGLLECVHINALIQIQLVDFLLDFVLPLIEQHFLIVFGILGAAVLFDELNRVFGIGDLGD